MCVRDHADIMGQLPDPVSLGGKTVALENAYQLQQFRWKQIVTSPHAPFSQGWGEGCKHHEQTFLPCDVWRMAQLLGEPWLISAWQVGFQSRSHWLVPPRSSFNPSSVHRTCFLPSKTLIPVSRWEDVEHLPLAFLSISVWRLGDLWVPWALSCSIPFPVGDRVRDWWNAILMLAVGTGHCCIVPLTSVLCRLTAEVTAKAELIDCSCFELEILSNIHQ